MVYSMDGGGCISCKTRGRIVDGIESACTGAFVGSNRLGSNRLGAACFRFFAGGT